MSYATRLTLPSLSLSLFLSLRCTFLSHGRLSIIEILLPLALTRSNLRPIALWLVQ